MEEKESTVSGSPGNYSETDNDSPPPVTSVAAVLSQQVITMNMNMNMEAAQNVNIEKNINAVTPGSGSSVDLLGKKKRGRPRKYDSEGNMRVAQQLQSQYQILPGGAVVTVTPPPLPPGFTLSTSDNHFQQQQHSLSSSKRGRGRPPGSGNWQLLASLGEIFAATAGGDFTPHVITVNTGEDVAGKILSFSQKGPRGICVLSANGAVSNVTIRQPGSSGGILTYEGRFEILSLSGSFTVTENGGARSRTGGLSVSLASPDGRVIGGGVAGLLLAASPIQIVVGSFMPNGYKVHKRKHNREQTAASVIPRVADKVTAAKPISQAKPEGETCLTTVSTLPAQIHEGTEINVNYKQIDSVSNSHGVYWNGSGTQPVSNQRPSPDINVSVPCEEDVEGVR